MQRKGALFPFTLHGTETKVPNVVNGFQVLEPKRLRPGGLEPPTEGAVNLNSSN